jgi:sulfatase maturation enzyme AslB (radical SAM superfamily)
MELSTKCPTCNSHRWCGRPCRHKPLAAEPLPARTSERQSKQATIRAAAKEVDENAGFQKAIASLTEEQKPQVREGKYDRNAAHRAYMRDYMRKRRAKAKQEKP